jgi:hypothetical protein
MGGDLRAEDETMKAAICSRFSTDRQNERSCGECGAHYILGSPSSYACSG